MSQVGINSLAQFDPNCGLQGLARSGPCLYFKSRFKPLSSLSPACTLTCLQFFQFSGFRDLA